MSMTGAVGERSLPERALEVLRRSGNPFRNYFARNPDDDVCARYHVPELFATERAQLLGVVDLYRYDPGMHSEVVPVLGNKGAGKTHLLHSIKHGSEGAWQLLVTPGMYQKDTDFLEYLLFQMIDTLLGGGRQKGARPLEFVSEALTRKLLRLSLEALTTSQRLDLFPAPGLARWTRHLGLGSSQAQERTQWVIDQLSTNVANDGLVMVPRRARVSAICNEAGLNLDKACELVCQHVERFKAHNTAGHMRHHIHQGFARAALLGDEADLAGFLTFGFAELEFQVKPTRQDLVLTLLKVLMEVFQSLKVPVVVAFDQMEDLLLARRTDDGHRVAESFFAGIVQAMHQIDGVCFLIFAERGLWNRFVPSLDGYIQDRLNNPIHVPGHGTIKALRLEAPPAELVTRIVEARMRPAFQELPDGAELSNIFPFNEEQIDRVARTEPTLRDMLQQFRRQFDHVVYGADPMEPAGNTTPRYQHADVGAPHAPREGVHLAEQDEYVDGQIVPPQVDPQMGEQMPVIKSMIVVETPAFSPKAEAVEQVNQTPKPMPVMSPRHTAVPATMVELWQQGIEAARGQLEPESAVTGATRELQAGLGAFLHACHEHGVKVGPWRLQHVVGELNFSEHPTYGSITIAHWACKDGQPWKVGIGLFLGRGAGKSKDLETKLLTWDAEPPIIDHLILLRPEDDMVLSGKSKTLWQDAERKGRHARLEAVNLDSFAVLYGFPRWLAACTESQPEGQRLPNLADFLQEHCDKLLEQVCMPVQG